MLSGKCNFVVQVIPPCKPILWQWVLEREIPPTVKEIADEYGLTIEQAIERAVQLITEQGFGFAKGNVYKTDEETVDLVIDGSVYILASKKHTERIEEMMREK